jgi:hypothetical protein
MEIDKAGRVEFREHVSVEDEKRVADAGLVRCESYGAGSVERLGLDDVLERDP